jgi:hypothetical protein
VKRRSVYRNSVFSPAAKDSQQLARFATA